MRKQIDELERAQTSPEFRKKLAQILRSLVNIIHLSDSGDVDRAHWQETGRDVMGADRPEKQSLADVLKSLGGKNDQPHRR